MAQRGRISEDAAHKAFELEGAVDALIEANGRVHGVYVGIVADGVVTAEEAATLTAAFHEQTARAAAVDALSDELTDLTDDVDTAIAVAVATVRTGVKGERRRRLLEEVRTDQQVIADPIAA